MKTTHCFILLMFLLLMSGSCNRTGRIPETGLVPTPDSIVPGKGSFTLRSTPEIRYTPLTGVQAKILGQQLSELFSMDIRVHPRADHGHTDNDAPSGINLSVDSSLLTPEAYNLEITPSAIHITGGDAAGCFYGTQTLLQLLSRFEDKPGSLSLPCMTISDAPALSWRGMHLDVSRHFFPVSFIKKYLDILALYKMNVFHWHLTDDQGWRIEIKQYPELTEKGAFREDRRDQPWDYGQYPVKEGKPVYGGFYTQEEIRDVVQYAANRGITVVPEIEMPGHSWAVLYVFPELSCSGTPFFKPDDVPFEFTDPYCAGNEATFTFLENVLDEVMNLFPSPYIHIGGDEAKKTPWESCEKCRRRMKEEGLENTEELQSYFIRRIEKYVSSHGRQIIGWDEILEGGLAEGAAVMSWRGEEGGIRAAQMGHPVVMTPSFVTYFNANQDLTNAENSRVITLEEVYRYNPVPAELTPEERSFILGAQGCLWTEHVQTPEEAEHQLLPRLLALAESVWNGKSRGNWKSFRSGLPHQYRILDRINTNYFIEPPHGLRTENAFIDSAVLKLENPYGFGEIRYTTDGSKPETGSQRYREPVTLAGNTVIHASRFLENGRQSRVVRGEFHKMKPRKGVEGDFRNGILLDYHEGEITTLDELPHLRRIRRDTVEKPVIPHFASEDHFALVFKGYMHATRQGVYTFTTSTDDGSRLFIHDSLLVDNDGIHGAVLRSGQVALASGYHPFRLEFFEADYGEELNVSVMLNGEKTSLDLHY